MDKRIDIRLDEAVKKQLVRDAKKSGKTISAYIRELILGARHSAKESAAEGVGWRSHGEPKRDRGDNGNISVSKTEDLGSTPSDPAIFKSYFKGKYV